MRTITKILFAAALAGLPIAAHGQAFPTLPVTPCSVGCTTINTLPPATQALLVDGSAVTQPISGTVGITGTLPAFAATPTFNLGTIGGAATEATLAAFSGKFPASLGAKTGAASFSIVPASDATFPAAQSGTWTVQPGNTANTTAWKVDGSAVTQPVSGTVTITTPANLSPQCTQTTSGAYVSGDAFGFASGAAGTGPNPCLLTGAFAAAGGSAIEGTVTIINYDNTAPYTGTVDVFITKADPNANAWTATDNVAFVFGTVTNVVGGIHSCTMVQRSANRSTCQIETALPLVAAAGSANLYCTIVIKGAFTANAGSNVCLVYMKG